MFSLAYFQQFPQRRKNAIGSVALILSAGFALTSNMLARQLSQCYPPMQILFYKGFVASLFLLILVMRYPMSVRGANHWWLHITRGFIGVLGNYLSVMGLKSLPIADATALSLTSAFWGLLGGVVILKEKASNVRILGTLAGFFGAMMIVRPGSINFNADALYPLAAALCFAVSVLIVRKTGKTDGPMPSMLGLYGVMTLAAIPWIPFEWVPVAPSDYYALCSVGLVSIMSMYFITIAYILAEASFLAPYKFIRYPMSICVGLLYFSDAFMPLNVFGGLIIVASLLTLNVSEQIKLKDVVGLLKRS